MLRSVQDTYIDYLERMLCHTELDMGMVRETLSSLGFDGNSINDILGNGPHVCATSTSSESSGFSDHGCSLRLSAVPDVTTAPFSHGEEFHFSLQKMDMSQELVDEQERKEFQTISRHASTSASSPPLSPSERLQTVHEPSLYESFDKVGFEARELFPFSERTWDDTLITPGLRHSYEKHLNALEKLLGVVCHLVDDRADGSVPLEIRSFRCRQRLQDLLLHRYRVGKISLTPEPRQKRGQSVRSSAGQEERNLFVGSRAKCIASCVRHGQCFPHHRSLLGGKRGSRGGTRRQCEFCVALEKRFVSPCRVDRFWQPQITSAALGNVCGVKMRPKATNTVGCGRIRSKAVMTTLLQREDRVEKALAYRNGWSTFGILDG